MIEVNVIFTGDFILPSTGSKELKTFNTKNKVTDQATNLDDWFVETVQEKILNELS